MATKKLQIIGNIATINDVNAVQSQVNDLKTVVEEKVSQTEFNEVAERISANEGAIDTLSAAVADKAEQDVLDDAIAKIAANETAIAENAASLAEKATQASVDTLSSDLNAVKANVQAKDFIVTAITDTNELTAISASFEQMYTAYSAGQNITLHVQTSSGNTMILQCTNIDADNAFFDGISTIAGITTLYSAIIFSDDTSMYVVGGTTQVQIITWEDSD